MIRGIIFDYGGTLDSRGDHWSEVIYRSYLAEGFDPGKQRFRDAYVDVERLFAREPIVKPDFDFHRLMQEKISRQLAILCPGDDTSGLAARIALRCYEFAREWVAEARPVLDALASRYPMVLVSNFYGNVNAVIAAMGIAPLFKAVVESAVVGVRKPDPQIFRLGCDALGLPPEQVLVVGDSLRKDILPAESIGCATAWIKGKGWTADEDAAEHPSQIPSLAALLSILQ